MFVGVTTDLGLIQVKKKEMNPMKGSFPFIYRLCADLYKPLHSHQLTV